MFLKWGLVHVAMTACDHCCFAMCFVKLQGSWNSCCVLLLSYSALLSLRFSLGPVFHIIAKWQCCPLLLSQQNCIPTNSFFLFALKIWRRVPARMWSVAAERYFRKLLQLGQLFACYTWGAAGSELAPELSLLFREELVRIWCRAFALSCFSRGPWEMGLSKMQSGKEGRSWRFHGWYSLWDVNAYGSAAGAGRARVIRSPGSTWIVAHWSNRCLSVQLQATLSLHF